MTDLGAARGAGEADWELEEFLRRREIDGTLAVLLRDGFDLAAKRRQLAQEAEQVSLADGDLTTQIAQLKESASASSLSPSDRLSGSDGDAWDDRWTDTEDGYSSTYSDGVDGDGFRLEDLPDVPSPSVCFASSSAGDQGVDGELGLPGFEADGGVAESPEVASPLAFPGEICRSNCRSETDLLPWPLKAAQATATCTESVGSGPLHREDDVASQCDHFGNVADGSAVTTYDLQSFLERLRIAEDALESHGWRHLMTRSTPTMQYASHSLDCAVEGYPKSTCYRGRMVVEGVTLEAVRDFLLDEDYRREWDENRAESTVLEDWNEVGISAFRWVRRLPLFLRNREYVVSRRVWSLTPETPPEPQTSLEPRTFFCINRSTSHASAVSRPSVLRVPYFYSSWRIRYVPGQDGTGGEQRNKLGKQSDRLEGQGGEAEGQGGKLGVEIVTYHQEESGLPRELARVALMRGMWGHMVKIEDALRQYCQARRSIRHTLPVFLTRNDHDHL
ncbi:hypothetical protein CLOM_g1512 [Closterium sp. NIES-68]|nr:hypothetical protein CLOM_g1512 [Closterium sp. NIES-68]